MADFGVTNTFTNGTLADALEVNKNFDDVEDLFNGNANSYVQTPTMVPIGSVVSWLKTFSLIDSGTANVNTLDALEDSGATFAATGVLSGMVIVNTTASPDTYAMANVVTATKVTLNADINGGSSVTDLFPLGTEAYSIYATPELPEGWVECNGQTLSGSFADTDSPYNGVTLPDLNASSGTNRFLRGSLSSGTTGGTEGSHVHNLNTVTVGPNGPHTAGNRPAGSGSSGDNSDSAGTLPSFYEIVWIMRIK